MQVGLAPVSIGFLLAIVVLILAILLGFAVLPFTAPVVAALLALLAVARLT